MADKFVVLVTTAPTLHEATRELATRLAGRANAVLLFMHIVGLRPEDGEGMLHTAVDISDGGEAEAWLRRQRPSESTVRFRHRFETGDPEALVASFVAQHTVELVLVEEPPRNWLSEALSRGFAERLMRAVHCPLVILGPSFLRAAPAPPAPGAGLAPTPKAGVLNAMVDARVETLRRWLDHAADSARRIAASATVRDFVLRAQGAGETMPPSDVERLGVELEEHRRALRAVGWQLTVAGNVWGGHMPVPLAGPGLVSFSERVARGGHSASLPLNVAGGSEHAVILAGARVNEEGGGTLLLAFDAQDDFLRILGQPGPVASFETYAFDSDGRMLSNSRFPDDLREAGLLPSGEVQTPLKIRVAQPSEGPMEDWPLTKMARLAVQHQDGWDSMGYLDYRGTAVVGAWRWLSDYGFGVAAEVDHQG